MRRTRYGWSGIFTLLLICALAFLPATGVWAQEDETEESATTLFPIPGKEGEEGNIRVQDIGGGFLDYDEQENTIYASARTRITYKGAMLEADQIFLDMDLMQAQAAGDIILTYGEGKITADRVEYDFTKQTGKAFGIEGEYGPIRVMEAETEEELPNFERVSENEMLFRNAKLTTCDFPKPHYYIKAREILVYPGDRVFLRGATLYVRDIPVFYLPFYSRGMGEGSPWMVRAGFKSGLGPWARVGYRYDHSVEEPSLQDDQEMVVRDEGALTLYVDYFMSRGPGAGINYDYSFNYGRHHGELDLYGMYDSERKIDEDDNEKDPDESGEEDQNTGRWYIGLQHRSDLTEDLAWTINSDFVSDPELFDEVLDLFRDYDRRRVMERTAGTALTYTRDSFVARLMFEIRDNISRDRIKNFSNFQDDDRDYDEEPDDLIENRDDEAINTNRWGHTSVRAPQVTLETTWLKLWDLPLYYHTDLNIFNNLDPGLNWVDPIDDGWVHGFDWYQALMWRWRIAKRTTLLGKAGFGVGMAARSDDEWNYDDDPSEHFGMANPVYPLNLADAYGGVTMLGPETIYIGAMPLAPGDTPDPDLVFSLDDVDTGFAYGDLMLHLRHRFSAPLTLDAIYTYRFATDDSLGDWYAEMGNRFVRDDIYNFRLREHNIRAALRYQLAQPNLNVGLHAFQNFIGEDERYPNEPVTALALAGDWMSDDQVWSVASSIGYHRTQIFHPADPMAYVDSSLLWSLNGRYTDPSGKWWVEGGTKLREELDQNTFNDNIHRYTEGETEFAVNALVGGYIGEKWKAEVGGEFNTRFNGLRQVTFNVERDLHDALLLFMLGFENDVYSDDPEEGAGGQMNFQIGLQPKLPNDAPIPNLPGLSVGQTNEKTPEVSASDFTY